MRGGVEAKILHQAGQNRLLASGSGDEQADEPRLSLWFTHRECDAETPAPRADRGDKGIPAVALAIGVATNEHTRRPLIRRQVFLQEKGSARRHSFPPTAERSSQQTELTRLEQPLRTAETLVSIRPDSEEVEVGRRETLKMLDVVAQEPIEELSNGALVGAILKNEVEAESHDYTDRTQRSPSADQCSPGRNAFHRSKSGAKVNGAAETCDPSSTSNTHTDCGSTASRT